jgi:predicted permease
MRMSWFRKLTATLRSQPLDTALDDELRFHLEERTDDFISQGLTREQARREAALLFGNRTLLRESTRERDVLKWLQTTFQDLRYALRTLRRSPGFAGAAVLSLALGIGANTAIFTLLDQVLLRTLPVAHPEQLAQLEVNGDSHAVNIGNDSLSYPMYRDIRDRNQIFSGVAGHFRTPVSVAFGERTERVEGELVTGNYFEVLGVGAVLGRMFNWQDDITPGGHPLAVLSYDYWVNRFHADRAVLGRGIVVDGLPLTIIGVSQKGFDGMSLGYSAKIRIPLAMKAQMTQGYFSEFFNLENRRAYWVIATARLKAGITRQQARVSLQPLFHSVLEMEVREKGFERASASDRADFLKSSLDVLPGSRGDSSLRREYDAPLRILMAIVGLVLLIACANVANLLLARAAARQREIAVRLAMGASAGRIARQALVESLLLAFAGGLAGLLLAAWMDSVLLRFIPTDFGPAKLMTTPDARVLAFTLGVSLITGLLFGMVPALATRKVDLAPTLKVDARGMSGGPARFRQALVVAQVSLSALLLIAAGQFLRSLLNLHKVDMGMRTRNVVGFSVNPSLNGYGKEQSGLFYRALLEKLREARSVEAAAATAIPVLDEDWWSTSISLDDAGPQSGNDNPNANLVSAGYFAALGIPLEAGRDFSPADAASKHRVAIVNQTFARKFFAGRNAVGHWIGLGGNRGTKTDIEVIGVSKDSKFYNVREEIRPQIYLDDDQNPDIQQFNVYLRTAMNAGQVAAMVRQVVRSIDPNIPVFALRTLDEQAELTLARDNMLTSLTSVFGALATALAAIGIYGLMSFSVARRTREIAVRMALGARSGSVQWLVMREVLTLAGMGVAIALPAAWALARLVQTQLYGVKAGDLGSTWMTVAALTAVALLAGYLPVRRAAGIDPMQALRSE